MHTVLSKSNSDNVECMEANDDKLLLDQDCVLHTSTSLIVLYLFEYVQCVGGVIVINPNATEDGKNLESFEKEFKGTIRKTRWRYMRLLKD